MKLRKKGAPFTAFQPGTVVYSQENDEQAKWQQRPVREKQYTLTADFIESYPDEGYWADMLSTDFEYVIDARVVDPSWTDPTRPPDGSMLVIVRGVVSDDTQPSTQG